MEHHDHKKLRPFFFCFRAGFFVLFALLFFIIDENPCLPVSIGELGKSICRNRFM